MGIDDFLIQLVKYCIRLMCDFLHKSEDVELLIKQLYVYQNGMDKSLDEIKEDFASLVPVTIELKNGNGNLTTEERNSFLLTVFDVLDKGIQIELNTAADKGYLGAVKAIDNRRHFDEKSDLRIIKNLLIADSQTALETKIRTEKLPSLFISYAREDDEPFVEKLYQDLKANGYDVWWDRATMKNRGRTFLQEIRDAIENSDLLIAVIGPKANVSDSVRYEWEHALLFSKEVIPILRIGDYTLLPPEMSKLHCLDFRKKRPYEKALQELIQILREPIPPLCQIIGVPSLPPNYLPRKEDLKKVNELISADVVKHVVITSSKQITAVQGMGGIGKSVLSASFARSTEARRALHDGIFWITVGLEPNLIEDMMFIGTKFGDELANYSSKREAEVSLSRVLSDKACLILLDNIWKVSDATPFVNALGSRCRLLITTRNGDVATSLGAQVYKIEVLREPQAMKLLANWCKQQVDSLPSEASEVARECGYLPLALSICGAMAKSGRSWSYILEALQEANLEFIEAQLPNYPDPNVGRALKVSVDFLSSEDPNAVLRYQELVIFPEDELIPETTITTLWEHTGNLRKRDVERLLIRLKDRSLLQLDGKTPNRLISLHDLQFDYLKATASDLLSLHNQLLEAYGKECKNKWSYGSEDGYFYKHLAYHMKAAGRKEELRKLLLDFEWISAKLNKVCIIQDKTCVEKPDVNSLIHDYDYLAEDKEVKLVQDAIRLSFNTIVKDRNQLAGQLLGRLLCFNDTEIRLLLTQLFEYKDGTRLLPITSSLKSPGGSLVRTLEGHGKLIMAVAVTVNGIAVSASQDNTLKAWDLKTGEEKITIKAHDRLIRAIAVTPDGKRVISASEDKTLKVWDIKTGEEQIMLKGHKNVVSAVTVTADGKYIVSASWDETIKVWDLGKEEERLTLKGHKDGIRGVAVTNDGKYIVSASVDRTVKKWDLETGEEKAELRGHEGTVTVVAVTPDGRYAVSASEDKTVKMWDLEKEVEKTTLRNDENIISNISITDISLRLFEEMEL